jgi:hypothetical protein
MYLYNLNYAYRAKTEAIFEEQKVYFFDYYILNDEYFSQHYLFENLWRETILLHSFDDERVLKVKSFGQLPNKIIYREVEE